MPLRLRGFCACGTRTDRIVRGAIKIRFRWSVVVNSEYILERPGAYTFVHLLKLGFHHLFKATKVIIIIINIIMSMGLPNAPSRSKHTGGNHPTHTTPQGGKGGNHQSPHPNHTTPQGSPQKGGKQPTTTLGRGGGKGGGGRPNRDHTHIYIYIYIYGIKFSSGHGRRT